MVFANFITKQLAKSKLREVVTIQLNQMKRNPRLLTWYLKQLQDDLQFSEAYEREHSVVSRIPFQNYCGTSYWEDSINSVIVYEYTDERFNSWLMLKTFSIQQNGMVLFGNKIKNNPLFITE